MTELAASDALPKPKRDLLPVLLPVILALAMAPLIGSGSSWVTLTVASLAASFLPALRVTRIDPVRALATE